MQNKNHPILLCCLLFLTHWVSAQTNTTPQPPQVNASSYILMDYHSGRVLASSNPDLQVEPASITKMMTAYVVFSEIKSGNLSLDEMITVSEKA